MRDLTDAQVLDRLQDAARREREAAAEVLALLAEVERRKLHEREGYSSLFEFCRVGLGYSEDDSFKKVRAARAANELPAVLSYLAGGDITMRAVSLLAPHLTQDNHLELLERAAHKPIREVERMVAALAPRQDAPDSVRRLPEAGGMDERGEKVEPLSPGRHRFTFTGSDELREMVERAQDLLSNKYSKVTLEDVFSEMARAFLKKRDPRQAPAPRKSPEGAKKPNRRRIPARVKRLVWLRDGGRCTYTSPSGRRCEARTRLEYDHIIPYSCGGSSDDPANLRMRCRAHNQLYARECFGVEKIQPRDKEGGAVSNGALGQNGLQAPLTDRAP